MYNVKETKLTKYRTRMATTKKKERNLDNFFVPTIQITIKPNLTVSENVEKYLNLNKM
jgi:hypothetical protein